MKNNVLKKISFMMVFLFTIVLSSVPVFAVTSAPAIPKNALSKGSITISKPGAKFVAYKLLDVVEDGGTYGYKMNSTFKDFFAKEKKYKIGSIKDLKGDRLNDFAVELHKYVHDRGIAGDELKNGVKNPVDLGYYLVLETSSESKGAAVVSAPMMASIPYVENNSWKYGVNIKVKDNEPTLEKNIIDENGSKHKTSTANIGDTINYEVNATIPVYQKDAENIIYKFTDKMSKGLTYDEKYGIKVTSGDKTFEKSKDYTVDVKKEKGKETEITINFIYDNIKDYAGNGITIKYQATLNRYATISDKANSGNTNDVYLEYTNNPYAENSYKKLEDKVTTYTFGFAVTKTDSEVHKKYLEGAEFSIENKLGKTVATYTYDKDGIVVPLNGNAVTDSNGVATFIGLKEGTYVIKEVVAPSGYKLLKDPIEVTIKADRVKEGAYTGNATMEISNGNEAGQVVENLTDKDGNVLLNLQVENTAGFSLPSTGGLGNAGFIKIAITLLSVVCVLALVGLGYSRFEGTKRAKH